MKQPLLQARNHHSKSQNSVTRRVSESYAYLFKTRVFVRKNLLIDFIGTLEELSLGPLHKYTTANEYLCNTIRALYLLNIIPLKNKSYVVSLQMICCVRHDKNRPQSLQLALSLQPDA